MNQATLDKIKKRLTAKKQELEKELGGFTAKDKVMVNNYRTKFPKFGDDEDENAAEVATYGDELSLEHALEKQLRDVNQALQSIADGQYGLCKYCHQAIEEKRLLIRPTSSSCVSCKKSLKGE